MPTPKQDACTQDVCSLLSRLRSHLAIRRSRLQPLPFFGAALTCCLLWMLAPQARAQAPTAVTLNTPTNPYANLVDLSWSDYAPNDFASYKVYRGVAAGVTSANGTLLATLTSKAPPQYTDSGATAAPTPGATYYYAVYVTNTDGLSAKSNEQSVALTSNPPAAVALNDPSPYDNSVSLSWSNSYADNFASYKVYRGTAAGVTPANGTLVTTITSASTTSAQDYGATATLPPGTTYYYIVCVVDTAGQSTSSNEKSITQVNSPPAAATLNDPSPYDTSVSLSWSQNYEDDFASYKLYRGTAAGVTPANGTLVTTITDRYSTTYYDPGASETVAPGTRYYYIVCVTDTAGQATPSTQKSILRLDAPPTAVTLNDPSPYDNSVSLSWSQNYDNDFAAYKVYRGTSAGVTPANGTLLATVATDSSTSFYDSTATATAAPGTTYYYIVAAVDAGGQSTSSAEKSILRLDAPPAAVTLDTPAAPYGNAVSLSWSQNSDEDFASYKVYRRISAGVTPANGTLVATITDRSTTNYYDFGATATPAPGTTYHYIVCVADAAGQITPSTEKSILRLDAPPTAVTLNPPVPQYENALSLSWSQNADSDFASYKLYRGTAAGVTIANGTLVATNTQAGDTSAYDPNAPTTAAPGTTYYYKLFVLDAGGQSTASNEVSLLRLNSPPSAVTLSSPTLTTYDYNGNGPAVSLAWTQSNEDDFASYKVYRGTAPGVTPANGTLLTTITQSQTLSYIDGAAPASGPPGTTYYYIVCVVDSLGQTSISNEASILRLEAAPIVVSIAAPANGAAVTALPAISGSTSEAGAAGLSQVDVSLQRQADGKYWNGTAWITGAHWLATQITGTPTGSNWSRDAGLPGGAAVTDGEYGIVAKALDGANNASTVASTVRVDTVAPQVTVAAPVANATVTGLLTASGQALDTGGSGVAQVQLRLVRQSDGQFWTGTAWSTADTALTTTLQGQNWTRSSGLPGGLNLSGGSYTLSATATDVAGNTQSAASNFSVALPQASVGDTAVAEGATGTVDAVVTVTLSAPSVQPVSFSYATQDGSALAPADYGARSGTLTIPAGQTSATIAVPIEADALVEADESFTVQLSDPVGAVLAGGVATVTITAAAPPPAPPMVSLADVTVAEGSTGTAPATAATFTLSLSAASAQTVTVTAATLAETGPGIAAAGADYTATSATVSFAPGETSKTFTVPVVGDTVEEPSETFAVHLSDAVGATVGPDVGDGTATGTIMDDDGTLPGAPQNLQATPSNGYVTLTWTPTTGATGYLVRRAFVTGGPYQTVERVTQARYVDTGLRNGLAYFYVVAALTDDGNGGETASPNSTEAGATPQWPPVAPSNLVATEGDGRVYLAWKAGARTEMFEVWRSITGSAWAKIAEVAPSATAAPAYTDTGLVNGRVHQYYILARNVGGPSEHSNTVSVVPAVRDTFAPGPPTFGARTSTSLVVIAPVLPQRATSMILQKRASTYDYDESESYITIATGLAGGSQVTAGALSPRSTYAFRLVAVGSGGQTAGYAASASTLPPAPEAPEKPNFSAIESAALNVLTPSLPPDALSFTLQRKAFGAPEGDYAPVTASVSGNSSVYVSGLSAGTRYDFRLLAVGEGGSTPGPTATVRTAPAAPAAPQFSQVTATSVAVTPGSTVLPTGATSLSLERLGSSSSYAPAWVTLASGLGATSVTTVSNLVPETSQTFRFVAVGESARTAGTQGYVTTPSGTEGAPGAPQYAEVTGTSVLVMPPSALDYSSSWTVQRKAAGQPDTAFLDCGTSSYSSPSLAVSGLSAGTAYAFRFVASGVAGGVVGAASTVTTAPPAPGVPSLSSRTSTSLTLTMPALPTGALSLRLERVHGEGSSSYGSAKVLAQNLAGAQNVSVSELSPGTPYAVRCVAVGPDGETPGNTASFSTAWGLPSAPEAPGFIQVRSTELTVAALPLPTGAQSLSLQKKLLAAPVGDYADVATGRTGQNRTEVPGLAVETDYSFRWVAVGEGGSSAGPGSDVKTRPLPPEAPGAPDLSFAGDNAAQAVLPDLPLRAVSLSLQKMDYYQNGANGDNWQTVATGQPGGASVTAEGLTPGQSISFRCVAVGPGGETIGATASITMPDGPPDAPDAPRFSDVREGALSVWSPQMPAGAYAMKLQSKVQGQPNADYYDVATNLGANVAREVDGLDANTSYDFRYVALAYGASTPGAVATVLMPTASVAWSAGHPISCGGISYPAANATLQPGQAGRLSAYLATDWDQRLKTVNGLQDLQDLSDPCSYTWSASAGSFAEGDNTGQSVRWIAPTTPGTYTLTLVVDDQNGQNKTAQEAGARDDAGRGFNEEPQRFSVRVTVAP